MNMRRARRLLALLMCLCLLGIATPEAVWAEESAASEGDAAVDSVQAASQPVMAPAEAPAGDGGGQGAAGSEAPADVPPATCAGNPEAGTVAGDERGADAPEQGAPENGEGQQDNAGAAPEGGAASAGAENPGAGAATGNEQDADAPEQGAPEGGEGQQDAGDAATEGGAPAEDAENPEDEAAAGDGADAEEAGEVPEEGSGESEEAGSEAAAELPSAAELPDFVRGYACVLGSATGYLSDAPDAEAEVVLDGGVVYALSRRASTGADRLECAFDDGAQERICWLDAAALRPMEQEEIVRFMEARLADEAVRFLSEDAALPLDRLECVEALAHPLVEETAELEPVVPEIPDLLVGQTELVLGLGEKRALDVGFSDGEAHGLRFSVKNTRIAKVSASGEVSARAVGSTTVRIESEFGSEASVKVTVKKAPSKLSLKAARTTLAVDERLKLSRALSSGSASALSYASSDPAVATVDADGEVVAVAPGTAKITARTFNGKKASVTLKIVSAPTDVTMEGELTLGVGQKAGLTPWLGGDGVGAYSFRCDDAGVLTVDAATGAIVALAVGAATVTVETYNGVSAACAVTVKPAPSCVTLEKTSLMLGVGEKVPMPGIQLGVPGEDCKGSYGIKTSNKKVVTVSADGVLRGVAAGSATVTVTTHNGRKATLKVTVRRAPSSVKLSAKQVTLGVDESVVLKATLPSKTAGAVRFESSNESVASVDAQGQVCALQVGEAVITAVSYNGKRAKCSVHVKPAPEGISLSQSELLLGVGEKFTLTAALSEGSAGVCTFSVADGSVASVDSRSGAVKGLAPGETVVSVRTYNGCEDACTLVVCAAPTGVSFQEKSVTLLAGDRYLLLPPVLSGEGVGCGSLSYKSSNTKYVKVSADGWVTGVRKGSAKLTVSTYNGKKATIWVYVKDAPRSIAFTDASVDMMVDEVYTPQLANVSGAAFSYTLSSSNPAVACVEGKSIRAVSSGSTVITATAFNGKTATLNVKVWALPTSVKLQPGALSLGAGDGAQLRPVLPEGEASTFRYESSDASVAAVDGTGAVQALKAGSATITVYTQNGLSSSCAVQVFKAPTRITLSPNRADLSLDEGGFQLAVAMGGAEEGGRYTFASSDEAVATVSGDGYVTLRGVGTARISVTSYNLCSASCIVNVGQKPSGMRFAQAGYAVALGDSVCIAPEFEGGCESYRLESSDPSVFAVSGMWVQALRTGSATLTATSRSGLQARCELTAAAAPTGIQLEPMSATLLLGGTSALQLTASALPDGVGSIRFTSSNPSIASVDYESGLVTAHSPGDCTITAVTYDGQYGASCALHVGRLLEGVKIGIDPGHQAQGNMAKESSSPKGGSSKPKVSYGTHGCSTRIKEHVTNLKVGLKLRDALEALGAEVYMTRETANVNISNKQRALMMNQAGVDLVLRLHCNSAGSSSVKGASLYIRKTCAYSSSVVNGKALMAAESSAAKAIMTQYCKATGFANRGISKTDAYTGNNWSTVPCILMEMGFSSNASEDRKMNDPAFQDRMVQGMVNGICVYMGRELPAQ